MYSCNEGYVNGMAETTPYTQVYNDANARIRLKHGADT